MIFEVFGKCFHQSVFPGTPEISGEIKKYILKKEDEGNPMIVIVVPHCITFCVRVFVIFVGASVLAFDGVSVS